MTYANAKPSRLTPPGHIARVTHGVDLLRAQSETRARVNLALEALARGETVIVAGNRHDGFVGALVAAADLLTPETVGFLITRGRGPVYATIDADRLAALELEVIRPAAAGRHRPALHVPVDARTGTTTGLSAADRAATIRALVDPASTAADFRVPGHVLPIGAREHGVLERPGHTEAAVDLARLAGLSAAAATCSMLSDTGATATVDEIRAFAAEHGLCVVQIADVAAFRRDSEDVVERVGEALLPIPEGRFTALGYRDRFQPGEHLALVMGDLAAPGPIMVRVHTECLAGDVFTFAGCACRSALQSSVREIATHGRGLLLYVRPPGGDQQRLRHLQPVIASVLEDVDERAAATDVNAVAVSMLRDLGVTVDHLLTEPAD